MEKEAAIGRMGAGTPLIGRAAGLRQSSVARYVAVFAAFGACALIVLVLNSQHTSEKNVLVQSAVKYYYVPKAAAKNNKLPLHLMIPQGKGKSAVEYTLVAAPLSQLDGNETAPAAPAAAKSASSEFVCSLANIKEKSAPVFEEWDKCLTASDYKQPNADAKRRLLSMEPDSSAKAAKTQSLKWVWVPAKGEALSAPPHTPRSWTASMWQMLDGNETAPAAAPAAAGGAKTLKECEAAASKDICEKLAKCKDPICSNYYNDPDVERICGICTMAAAGWIGGCFAGHAQVAVQGRGTVRLDQVRVGERVEAADARGARTASRVYFIHDHAAQAPVVQIKHAHGLLELTPSHSLPVYTDACGESYCDAARLVLAKTVRRGDRIYAAAPEGLVATTVTSVGMARSAVRYIITESGNLVVGGTVASVLSTAAGRLETLPFALLDKAWPGVLQAPPVTAALYAILESPALRLAEMALEGLARPFAMGELLASLRRSPSPAAAPFHAALSLSAQSV